MRYLNRDEPYFLSMLRYGDHYPWSQRQIDAAYTELRSTAQATAAQLASQSIPESELMGKTSTWIPETKGFLGFGAKPGYSQEQPHVRQPGGWRILRRCAFRDWSDCGVDWPRPRHDSFRCDEVWLTREGALVVATINQTRYAPCPYSSRPPDLPSDYVEENFHPAEPDHLLAFDIRYFSGFAGRDLDYGQHEEFRPQSGPATFSEYPFACVSSALMDGVVNHYASLNDLW